VAAVGNWEERPVEIETMALSPAARKLAVDVVPDPGDPCAGTEVVRFLISSD